MRHLRRGNRLLLASLLVIAALQPKLTFAQQHGLSAGMLRSDTFGPGWVADSLANYEIGRFTGRLASYRFRADHTGTFKSIEVYFAFQSLCDGCYANGNGGIIQVQVQTDDGTASHLPSGVVLGTAVITDPMKQWNRVVTLDTTVNAQSGTLYHIVFTNLSPDPVHNYTSIDTLYNAAGGTDSQPAAYTADLAVLTQADANHPLQVDTCRVPIFTVTYDDGYHQGQFYIDVRKNTVVGATGFPVSEAFIVKDAKHVVSSLSIRLSPMVAAGKISVAVANNTNQILALGTIDLTNAIPNVYNWYTIAFPQISLFRGAYTIVMQPSNGAQFYISPIQQGTLYGFQWETIYTGQCQVMSSSKWSGCLGRTDLDIPFYFR